MVVHRICNAKVRGSIPRGGCTKLIFNVYKDTSHIEVMEREERNNLIEKIRNFVKRDKKGHLKKRCQVLDFIQELLGPGESQHINFFGRFESKIR